LAREAAHRPMNPAGGRAASHRAPKACRRPSAKQASVVWQVAAATSRRNSAPRVRSAPSVPPSTALCSGERSHPLASPSRRPRAASLKTRPIARVIFGFACGGLRRRGSKALGGHERASFRPRGRPCRGLRQGNATRQQDQAAGTERSRRHDKARECKEDKKCNHPMQPIKERQKERQPIKRAASCGKCKARHRAGHCRVSRRSTSA
jgi:hypothetical protein